MDKVDVSFHQQLTAVRASVFLIVDSGCHHFFFEHIKYILPVDIFLLTLTQEY